MATQVRKQATKTTHVPVPGTEEGKDANAKKRAELDAEIDALLDEIDEVLDAEGAQAFVSSYIQKGGQ